MKKTKRVKFSIGEAIVANLKKTISEGKAPRLDVRTKKVIEKLVKESLEKELENYIETGDEMGSADSLDVMGDEFDSSLEGEVEASDFQDYNIDLEQLDDSDEIVINIDRDGNMKIDKIITDEGEEFTADELEGAGVIEKVKREDKTRGAGRPDPNKRGKMKYVRDDSDRISKTEPYKSGDVTSKMYENVNISGVDLTIDPESEAMVDEEGNVQFIDDVEDSDILSGDDIEIGTDDDIEIGTDDDIEIGTDDVDEFGDEDEDSLL